MSTACSYTRFATLLAHRTEDASLVAIRTVSKTLTSSARLCQENAKWIVEDFEENGSLVPFANFGTVSFTGAKATTSSRGSHLCLDELERCYG
ncbi:peptidase A4 family-domain-containing protein [Mycena sp. CBHHK59/15]|nr:peptidase A4 family-domain-containing protein [Mycena sp. CBHHK59/15]